MPTVSAIVTSSGVPRTKRRPARRSRQKCASWARRQLLVHLDAAQDRHRRHQHQRVDAAAPAARPTALISAPAKPGPATSAPELASALRAWASTRRSRGTTCVSTICAAAAGDDVDAAHHEADDVHPRHRQPAQRPGQRHAGHDQGRAPPRRRCRPAACARGRARRRWAGRAARRARSPSPPARPSASGVACSSTAAVSGSASMVTWPPSELIRIELHRRR